MGVLGGLNMSLIDNFIIKGKNYKRSGMSCDESIKASRQAFRKAIKLGENEESLIKAFKKGFFGDD